MQALILAGGSGTRFWPSSRRSRPKQLLPIAGDRSFLQITLDRLSPLIEPQSVWICTTQSLAEAVRSQIPEVPAEQILAEPEGRNTAPAIAWAVSQMPKDLQQGVVVVLPADHFMADNEGFRRSLETAGEIADADRRIMTLGVLPTRAETGYGYLELSPDTGHAGGLRLVRRFTEKPDAETAQRFLESGDYLWNAGIFVFPGELLLERVGELEPEIASGLEAIREHPDQLAALYGRLPSISIDNAVMEKLSDLGTLPLDCGWSDLGSWEALWELLEQDEDGNVLQGSVVAIDSTDSLVRADRGTVAIVGVEGLIVVRTEDAVLVIPKERSQEVRQVIAALADSNQTELL
jgi:mannose-1-phosphate guanylyltransferase